MDQYITPTTNYVVDANATSLGEGRSEQVIAPLGDCETISHRPLMQGDPSAMGDYGEDRVANAHSPVEE